MITHPSTYRVLIGTFNVNCHTIDQDLSIWLLTNSRSSFSDPSAPPLIPDIVAVGFQELTDLPTAFLGPERATINTCRNLIDRALSRFSHSYHAEGFTLLAQVSHAGRAIFVYVRDATIRGRVQAVETSYVGFGFQRLMSNKGAVGVWLRIQGKRPETEEDPEEEDVELCFVNTHLSPHDWNVKRRNKDFAALAERLVFMVEDNGADIIRRQHDKGKRRQSPRPDDTNELLLNSGDAASTVGQSKNRRRYILRTIYTSDYTFLFGDLNYRISLTAPGSAPITVPLLLGLITDSLPDLRPYDQLTIERTSNRTLQGFQEGPLEFPPTYKFSLGSEDEYQTTLRVPSWCDRILWWHRTSATTPSIHSVSNTLEEVTYDNAAPAQHYEPSTTIAPLRRLSLPTLASPHSSSASYSQPLILHTYTSHPVYCLSDHKPVSALLTIYPSALAPRAASERAPRDPDAIDPYWNTKRGLGIVMDWTIGFLWLLIANRFARVILLGVLVLGGWMAFGSRARG